LVKPLSSYCYFVGQVIVLWSSPWCE